MVVHLFDVHFMIDSVVKYTKKKYIFRIIYQTTHDIDQTVIHSIDCILRTEIKSIWNGKQTISIKKQIVDSEISDNFLDDGIKWLYLFKIHEAMKL